MFGEFLLSLAFFEAEFGESFLFLSGNPAARSWSELGTWELDEQSSGAPASVFPQGCQIGLF